MISLHVIRGIYSYMCAHHEYRHAYSVCALCVCIYIYPLLFRFWFPGLDRFSKWAEPKVMMEVLFRISWVL